MERSKVRVLVVDDFAPWRHFVISTIRKHWQLLLVGEADDGLRAIEKATELTPDLITMDIAIPTLNGIEASRRISDFLPKAKVVFLSENRSVEIVEHVLREGACGYVVKSSAASELLPAIETVLQGGRFVSECLADSVMVDLVCPTGQEALTPKRTRT